MIATTLPAPAHSSGIDPPGRNRIGIPRLPRVSPTAKGAHGPPNAFDGRNWFAVQVVGRHLERGTRSVHRRVDHRLQEPPQRTGIVSHRPKSGSRVGTSSSTPPTVTVPVVSPVCSKRRGCNPLCSGPPNFQRILLGDHAVGRSANRDDHDERHHFEVDRYRAIHGPWSARDTSALRDDVIEILSGDRLAFRGGRRSPHRARSTVITQQDLSPLPPSFCEQAAHLLIDDLLSALGIGPFLAEDRGPLAGRGWSDPVADGSEPRRQPPLGHHLDGQLGGTREITGRPGGGLADDQDFRGAAAEADGQGNRRR